MVKLKLKDGSIMEVEKGSSILDVAKKISEGLARIATCGEINGKVEDLRYEINEDCELVIHTFQDDDLEGKKAYWHTTSHIMAQAIKRLYGDVKLTIGPAIENGFYYDFDTEKHFSEEDFEKMAAITPTEDGYFQTSVFKHAKSRILWLLILMLSSAFTGNILTTYENAFAAVPLLVAFIPMIMGTGGNCGSQSSTLIIRGLATDEIKLKDIFRVLWKEIRVAIVVGIALAIVNTIRIMIQYQNLQLAIVLSITLIATVIVSKVIGCTLP